MSAIQPANAASPPKPPNLYQGYTTTLLSDGKWLVAGGETGNSSENSDEATLYDPATGTWTKTGKMNIKRRWHAATLLPRGNVLVTGGFSGGSSADHARGGFVDLASAELYDPTTGKWTAITPMNSARLNHTATLLSDGKVLLAGGTTNGGFKPLSTAEVFDPTTEKRTTTGTLNVPRHGHAAVLLTNGLVLIAGGMGEDANFLSSAELYDPSTGTWRMTGGMTNASRSFYTAELLTNGLALFTTSDTNAWETSKERYDPASQTWAAIGPRRPHFVSSKDLDRTLTISPESGSSFLACQEIELLIESADRFGVTNISLFRDNVKVAESEESPMRYTVTNAAAGHYIFVAKAQFANGLASTSSPTTINFTAPGPQVSMFPGPTEFLSSPFFNSSPATLLVSVVGINPDALARLTLNGVEQPLRTGNFALSPPLREGENTFVLAATDRQGRTARVKNVVYLKTSSPQLSITRPTNGSSFTIARVNVAGTFREESLSELTVNGRPAFLRRNTFEALNVFLGPGTNAIAAVAVDAAGNAVTNRITVMGPADTNAHVVDPVQLQVDPPAGFAPLTATLTVKAQVPGQLRRVVYDFDGDHVADRIERDLRPITVTFQRPGQRFPVVTLETSAGEFSTVAGYSMLFASVRINVQIPPVLVRTINIPEPFDLKEATNGDLYVLSSNPAMITQFAPNGNTVRALKPLASKPSGFDVDQAGNVYVALSGANQVWKFKPTAGTFEVDTSFGNSGFIGSKDGTAGVASNQFNGPFDVALTPDEHDIIVADSGNDRLQRFTANGLFQGPLGGLNAGLLRFNRPRGAVFDSIGHLYTVDSGNGRVTVADLGPDNDLFAFGTSGGQGTAPGEFDEPMNLCLGERGLCVADTGNNRVQIFEPDRRHGVPLTLRVAVGKELKLKRPGAVAWAHSFVEELLYIADTGNGRVLLVRLPIDSPEPIWDLMKESMRKGDIERTMACFTAHTAPGRRQSLLSMGAAEMRAYAGGLPPIKPVTIERDEAQYRFDQVIQGTTITFPVQFVRELGVWKIDEF